MKGLYFEFVAAVYNFSTNNKSLRNIYSKITLYKDIYEQNRIRIEHTKYKRDWADVAVNYI